MEQASLELIINRCYWHSSVLCACFQPDMKDMKSLRDDRIQTLPCVDTVSCSSWAGSMVDDNTRMSAFLNWSKSTWNKEWRKKKKNAVFVINRMWWDASDARHVKQEVHEIPQAGCNSQCAGWRLGVSWMSGWRRVRWAGAAEVTLQESTAANPEYADLHCASRRAAAGFLCVFFVLFFLLLTLLLAISSPALC